MRNSLLSASAGVEGVVGAPGEPPGEPASVKN